MKKTTLPYLRSRKAEGIVRIEVGADSMRVGKTTAVEVISEGLLKRGLKVTVSLEDWQHNPYLTNSYADPQKAFLESQKWFAKRKWEQITSACEGGVFIQDVHPEMDYCYARASYEMGRMSRSQFETYDRYFHKLSWEKAPVPDLLVYLTASDEVLLKRANESRREFEVVDENYFLTLKKFNRQWVNELAQRMPLLVIDTDKLDFAKNEKDKARLIAMVVERLG